MLIKLHDNIEKNAPPHLWWEVDGHKTATPGAQPKGAVLKLCLELPRVWGAAAVVCRINPDGGEYRDIPMAFVKTQNGIDLYTLSLNTATLCGGAEYGLFYYELLLVRGWDTLFSHTPNNVDLTFARESGSHFRLLVYKKELSVPSWFAGGTMYHIFLDRFCRGEGSVTPNYDAVINPDWANGIPQYARRRGDALSNNVFFGGNLWGVIEKLDYLASLGVTVLYLSPVFEAYSNHRYDTGDYEKIDAFLGGEEAFDALKERFVNALNGDLNTSLAVTAVYDVLKAKCNDATKLALVADFDKVLSLNLLAAAEKLAAKQAEEAAASADPEIDALVAARTEAKKAKNWAEADRIRDELKARGIEIIDTPQGAKWRKV